MRAMVFDGTTPVLHDMQLPDPGLQLVSCW